jgi:threonine/homoserine efflux transporter RhtA
MKGAQEMSGKSVGQIVTLAFKGIAVAMAVAAVVTNVLGAAAVETQALLLGIGLAALAITALDSD